MKTQLKHSMETETKILKKLKKEFRESVDSTGEPDDLANYTKGAIKRFIAAKSQYMYETIDACDRDEATASLIETDFFRLPIGREFIKRKIFYDMMSNIQDRGYEYIQANTQNVWNAVDKMYEAYAKDNELNNLRNPEGDWCREYLYEHITTTNEDD